MGWLIATVAVGCFLSGAVCGAAWLSWRQDRDHWNRIVPRDENDGAC